jgi:hypothetical protein
VLREVPDADPREAKEARVTDTTHYDAVEMPRGNLVVAMPSREVFKAFPSMQEAQAVARQLNAWLDRPSEPDYEVELFTWEAPGDLEQRLFRILDRMLEPERLAA